MQDIPLAHEQIRILAQIGLMAARRCDTDTAEVIFAAIARSHPDRSMAYAGQAMARLAVGRLPDALAATDRGLRLAREEDHADLHAIRGLVLKAAGRQNESEAALRQAGSHPLAEEISSLQPAVAMFSGAFAGVLAAPTQATP